MKGRSIKVDTPEEGLRGERKEDGIKSIIKNGIPKNCRECIFEWGFLAEYNSFYCTLLSKKTSGEPICEMADFTKVVIDEF